MPDEKTVVENTTPLNKPTVVPPGDGRSPSVESTTVAQDLVKQLLPQSQIEKAITLVELQKDLAQMVRGLESLQKQVVAQMGAIQYVQQKIAQLNKVPSDESERVEEK